jgi:hypothetical protein
MIVYLGDIIAQMFEERGPGIRIWGLVDDKWVLVFSCSATNVAPPEQQWAEGGAYVPVQCWGLDWYVVVTQYVVNSVNLLGVINSPVVGKERPIFEGGFLPTGHQHLQTACQCDQIKCVLHTGFALCLGRVSDNKGPSIYVWPIYQV